MWQQVVVAILAAALAIVGAGVDIKKREVPDLLTLPILVAGLILNTISSGWHGLEMSGLGIAAAAGLFFVLSLLTDMPGMGDVKALAAAGALLGPQLGVLALLSGVLWGGPLVLAAFATSKFRKKSITRHMALPYMPALSAGIAYSAALEAFPYAESRITTLSSGLYLVVLATSAAACCVAFLLGGIRKLQRGQLHRS